MSSSELRTKKNIAFAEKAEVLKPDELFGPHTVRRMRVSIARGIERTMPHAVEVLEGKRIWTPVQAAVFKTLLAKVLPDLEAKAVSVEVRDRPLAEMTRQELERLLAAED